MDIRTKLVFTLVVVSLAGMFALGAVAYNEARQLLERNARRQLSALAETKQDDLEKVIHGWEERVQLIASRTQLRLSLAEYNTNLSTRQQERIRDILADALESVETIQRLTVYDISGRPVATTASEGVGAIPSLERGLPEGPDPLYEGVALDEHDSLSVSFLAPLVLQEARIGALHVVFGAQDLVDVTEDFTGLGETGETLVVLRGEGRVPRILHPVRKPGVSPGILMPQRSNNPANLAIQGIDSVFSEGVIDYRGEPVWAATRYLPQASLGLVVKFDTAEELKPIKELRSRLIRVGLSLSAFAILIGTLLGIRFARPIQELAEVADRIRKGDLDARAQPRSGDEIGLLARTFNEMAEELEDRITGADDDGGEPPGGESESLDRVKA